MRDRIWVLVVLFIAISLLFGIAAYYGIFQKKATSTSWLQESRSTLIRQCPEHWYFNKMPGRDQRGESEKQYFIIDGARYDYEEVDVEWVKQNCGVNQPEEVY